MFLEFFLVLYTSVRPSCANTDTWASPLLGRKLQGHLIPPIDPITSRSHSSRSEPDLARIRRLASMLEET